ncbi:MAG: hypothetical protein AB7O32_09260 [Vicinamibacterales bacterium]
MTPETSNGPRAAARALRRLLLAAGACACALAAAARPAHAQAAPGTPGGGSGRTPFFAVDVFGGTHPQGSTSAAPNPPAATFGWEIAGTIRPARSFGIVAAVGRVRTPERHWIDHVQVGPRVLRTLDRVPDLRLFAHLLAGRAKSRLATGATASSLELMAGGGVDAFNVFRFELDLVRRDLDAFPKTDARFLFGVAIPLCVTGCRAGDGFPVRGGAPIDRGATSARTTRR